MNAPGAQRRGGRPILPAIERLAEAAAEAAWTLRSSRVRLVEDAATLEDCGEIAETMAALWRGIEGAPARPYHRPRDLQDALDRLTVHARRTAKALRSVADVAEADAAFQHGLDRFTRWFRKLSEMIRGAAGVTAGAPRGGR